MKKTCANCRFWTGYLDFDTEDPNCPTVGECSRHTRYADQSNARVTLREPFNKTEWIEHQLLFLTDREFSCSEWGKKR